MIFDISFALVNRTCAFDAFNLSRIIPIDIITSYEDDYGATIKVAFPASYQNRHRHCLSERKLCVLRAPGEVRVQADRAASSGEWASRERASLGSAPGQPEADARLCACPRAPLEPSSQSRYPEAAREEQPP